MHGLTLTTTKCLTPSQHTHIHLIQPPNPHPFIPLHSQTQTHLPYSHFTTFHTSLLLDIVTKNHKWLLTKKEFHHDCPKHFSPYPILHIQFHYLSLSLPTLLNLFCFLSCSPPRHICVKVVFTFSISLIALAPSSPIPFPVIHSFIYLPFSFPYFLPHRPRVVNVVFTFRTSLKAFAPPAPMPFHMPTAAHPCQHILPASILSVLGC